MESLWVNVAAVRSPPLPEEKRSLGQKACEILGFASVCSIGSTGMGQEGGEIAERVCCRTYSFSSVTPRKSLQVNIVTCLTISPFL